MDRFGRYTIDTRIAQGRSCDVYLGHRDEASGFRRTVAIKAMSRRLAGTGEAVRAFLDEVRVTGLLLHPNIVQAIDVDEDRGRYFMALEHVPGKNLKSLMASLSLRRRIVPFDVAMTIARDLAEGLHHAHMLGFVHRDVTPSNAMVAAEGYAKLIDWGTAVAVEDARSARRRVRTATRYSAPEIVCHDPVDARADVYSLGAILFELTTGSKLFTGTDPINRIAQGDVPAPSTVRRGYPPSLEGVVKRALAHAADDRFQTAGDLQLAIETIATEHRFPLSTFRVAGFLKGVFDDLPARPGKPRTTEKTRIFVSRRRSA